MKVLNLFMWSVNNCHIRAQNTNKNQYKKTNFYSKYINLWVNDIQQDWKLLTKKKGFWGYLK